MRGFELTQAKEDRYTAVLRDRRYPVQIVWGSRDSSLTLAVRGEQALRAAGLTKVTMLPGRHFLQEDQAPAIADAVAAIARLSASLKTGHGPDKLTPPRSNHSPIPARLPPRQTWQPTPAACRRLDQQQNRRRQGTRHPEGHEALNTRRPTIPRHTRKPSVIRSGSSSRCHQRAVAAHLRLRTLIGNHFGGAEAEILEGVSRARPTTPRRNRRMHRPHRTHRTTLTRRRLVGGIISCMDPGSADPHGRSRPAASSTSSKRSWTTTVVRSTRASAG